MDNKKKLTDDEREKVAGGGEDDDPKGGYKYLCTTCGGECCFEFIVVNPICPSCGNSTLQEVDQKKQLEPWKKLYSERKRRYSSPRFLPSVLVAGFLSTDTGAG